MSSIEKVVAIDGPSGSGKSTLAKQLADVLGALYIDSGAMYRAVGLWAHEQGLELTNIASWEDQLKQFSFHYGDKDRGLVFINGKDRSLDIRAHEVSKFASIVSKHTVVREYLVSLQRKLGRERLCVMEGRDIGTVVFPYAFCKIFLTASVETRAKRRELQLEEMGQEVPLWDILLNDIKERDHQDMTRDVAPLKRADDALELDTSNISLDGVLKKMEEMARSKMKDL